MARMSPSARKRSRHLAAVKSWKTRRKNAGKPKKGLLARRRAKPGVPKYAKQMDMLAPVDLPFNGGKVKPIMAVGARTRVARALKNARKNYRAAKKAERSAGKRLDVILDEAHVRPVTTRRRDEAGQRHFKAMRRLSGAHRALAGWRDDARRLRIRTSVRAARRRVKVKRAARVAAAQKRGR